MEQTIQQAIEAVTVHAKAKVGKEYRLVREIEEGQAVRQGDVYILRVKDGTAFSVKTQERQLAPGTSKGSRHVVEGDVRLFAKWDAPANLFKATAAKLGVSRDSLLKMLSGPAIQADGAFRVTHPEHADFTLPAGCYVTYGQLDPKTMRRVQD